MLTLSLTLSLTLKLTLFSQNSDFLDSRACKASPLITILLHHWLHYRTVTVLLLY